LDIQTIRKDIANPTIRQACRP